MKRKAEKCPNCGGRLEIEPNASDPQTKSCVLCSALFYIDNAGKIHELKY